MSTTTKKIPHNPTDPLLTKSQYNRLDGCAIEITELLKERELLLAKANELKAIADEASSRVDRTREGKVEEDGKQVTDLNEENLSMYISRAESALILARGRYKQASANADNILFKLSAIKQDLCDFVTETLSPLMQNERSAWETFISEYFEPGYELARKAREAAGASKVGSFLDATWSVTHRIRTYTRGDDVSNAKNCLALIEQIKAGPRL